VKKSVTVEVPASSGNLGPGFDVLGLALSLRNVLTVKVLRNRPGQPQINILGEGARSLPRNRKNIVFKAIELVFKKARKPVPKLELVCVNRIPLARGLGSSAAASLSGLLAGNALIGKRFSMDQILTWASDLEGHPDNVAPALYGGIRASARIGGQVVSAAWPVPKVNVILAVPDFKLSTKKARAVLPARVPLRDAVLNLSSVALMPFALSRHPYWLRGLLNDRLHEPYRAKLIPGFAEVKKAALKAGALGVTLSGAGPSMMSLVETKNISRVSIAMGKAFRKKKVQVRILKVGIDRTGALVR